MSKIVNVYIVYDLDASPRNSAKNAKFKNWLFGATSVVKNSDKKKYVYSGYGIIFDSAGSWIFDNDFSRNVMIIVGVDNSSSSHADKRKNDFVMLAEGPTFEINGIFGLSEKNFSINFSKENTKFALFAL